MKYFKKVRIPQYTVYYEDQINITVLVTLDWKEACKALAKSNWNKLKTKRVARWIEDK